MKIRAIALPGSMLLLAFAMPRVGELPRYLEFANDRTILGIPNFWNVISNVAFLAAALFGLRAFRSKAAFSEPWERTAYAIVIAGTALASFGSTYFHWNPTPATLFWDRLPMSLIFMGLFAAVIGDGALLGPLVALGMASILWWRWSGDLRLYAVVQFVPMLAIPLLLLVRRPRYSESRWMWGLIGLYALAKVFEVVDRPLGGGHPWKHIAAAAAMCCYSLHVSRRRLLRSFDNTCPPSVL